jgi:2-polyprenyl-3-methyl-5-hydroxy-6-metoxy-1,4-benzoquinol methylase
MSYEDCNALGGMTAYNWEMDPKRLAFQFARYKHVAKLLEGKKRVLEVGCSDGMGARIVRQHVEWLVGVDSDEAAIAHATRLSSQKWPIHFQALDFMAGEPMTDYDAVYSLDVLEHFEPREIYGFLARMAEAAPMAIIGTPSIESQKFASEISRREHKSCMTKAGLRIVMSMCWRHVIILGMNDETLHTGHDGMTHYLLGIGIDKVWSPIN